MHLIYQSFGFDGIERVESFHNIDELNVTSLIDLLTEVYEMEPGDPYVEDLVTRLWVINEHGASCIDKDGQVEIVTIVKQF